jgi:hypothetical protein
MDNIILEFPRSNIEIDLGEVVSFDEISGKLPLDRTTGNLPTTRLEGDIPMSSITGDLPVNRLENVSGLVTAEEAHNIWNEA